MGSSEASIPTAPGGAESFCAILALLRERTGTDFARYRAPTITRRICNRMISVGVSSFEQYLERLRADDSEARQLLKRVTIKVSRFYRNSAAFDALRFDVLPELARAAARAPLRIWSAGCGCGEEAYTLALLLEENDIAGAVEATDIDEDALDVARRAHYPAAALAEMPEALLARHFDADGRGYSVRPAVRARVRFARYDLTSPSDDAPAQLDLVCCRNVLIYFNRDTQEQAMRHLRARVRDGGYLCLGEAEWPLPSLAQSFVPYSRPLRIFRAAPSVQLWSSP